MSKPWEPQPGESARWFGRFQAYLLLGPERSVDEAFRRSIEGDQSGTREDRGTPPRRAPGSWKEAAARWEWATRARAYDADSRARLRRAHQEKLRKASERHQTAAQALFGKAIKAMAAASTEGLSLPQAIACVERAVNLERRALGEPLDVELAGVAGGPVEPDHDGQGREPDDISPDRFRASPEVFAQTMLVMQQFETKYLDVPAADAPPPSPAPADEPAAEPAPPDPSPLPEEATP